MFIASIKDKAWKIKEWPIHLLKDMWTCHIKVWITQEKSLTVKIRSPQSKEVDKLAHSPQAANNWHRDGWSSTLSAEEQGPMPFQVGNAGPCAHVWFLSRLLLLGPTHYTDSWDVSIAFLALSSTCYKTHPPSPARGERGESAKVLGFQGYPPHRQTLLLLLWQATSFRNGGPQSLLGDTQESPCYLEMMAQ